MSARRRQLNLCRACGYFVKPEEMDCPFCGADLAEAALDWSVRMAEAKAAAAELARLLREAGHDVEQVMRIYR